jgi:hypothetical protein
VSLLFCNVVLDQVLVLLEVILVIIMSWFLAALLVRVLFVLNVFAMCLMIDLECLNLTLNPNNFVELYRLKEHKWTQPVVDFLLKYVYIDNPWDPKFSTK